MSADAMLVQAGSGAVAAEATPNAAWDTWMRARLAQVEQALDAGIEQGAPAGLGQAMRYAVLDGGKRVRPLLVLAAAQAVAGSRLPPGVERAAIAAACAVEAVHAYSLVHDDMPCMDNDVLRRGKPTVHVKFGEAQALLAGDALQAIAFEWLTPADGAIAPAMQARLCGVLARASGYQGMAGGQAIDLAQVGRQMDEAALADMHARKTGALLQASVWMGAIAAGATTAQEQALLAYARAIGLAFQVVDDVLDATADTATLGKTAGKDADAQKPTYVSLLGLAGARQRASTLHQDALHALQASGLGLRDTHALESLALMIVDRRH
jgi:farnesyl diphosphate synthase